MYKKNCILLICSIVLPMSSCLAIDFGPGPGVTITDGEEVSLTMENQEGEEQAGAQE